MSTDHLALTAYFGERLAIDDKFVAEELLNRFEHSGVATSVLLRGVTSFGPAHVLRTDQTLSMSEDPPVAVTAVDTADLIAELAERAVPLIGSGLVTLEPVAMADSAPAPDTAKLTVWVGRRQRVAERSGSLSRAGLVAYAAVCEMLHHHGFSVATAFLGVDGTVDGRRRRARFFSGNVNVPVLIVAVGTGDQVHRVIPELTALQPRPLLTVERAQLCKRDGLLLARPLTPPADTAGRWWWQKLTVHTSEADLRHRAPIHRAIVARLRDAAVVSGATVLRGVWGFSGTGKPHGDKLFQHTRRVPVSTIIVDTPDRIAAAFDIVDELTDRHGLVTSEWVPAAVSIDAGHRRGSTSLSDRPDEP